MHFIGLILSLPTENATVRMRAWRTLKAAGAAVLRDGVYLMPERDRHRALLDTVATDVRAGGGTAHVVRIEESEGAHFIALFDRSEDYAALLADLGTLRETLTAVAASNALKRTRKLRKMFASLSEIDFFPGEARKQADAALQELELAVAQALTPDEPHPVEGDISRLQISDYQGRTWATRHRPWVDRLACAWLIRRFIDPGAQLLWLTSPSDCPVDALGFDFDGATFSHVGARVTFEVLLARFGLETPELRRLGALIHCLDVGGVQPPEAAGMESILAGLRATILDDDQLLAAVTSVFDGLINAFSADKITP